MKTLHKWLTRLTGWLCIILFALLVVTTVWQVFSRLVLHSPVTWSEELAKILFVWLSFLGAALVYGERGHMAVEILARRFSEKTERGLAVFTHVVGLVFALVILTWGGWNAAMNAWTQNLTALPINIGSVYLVMPLAGVIMAVYAVDHIIEIGRGDRSPYPTPEAELAVAEGEKVAAEADLEEANLNGVEK